MLWDESFDARAAAWAADAARGDVAAWRALLVAVAPEVERWATRHPTLRRWRLNSPDDARAVLVAVIERLAARDFAALRAYHTRDHAGAAAPLSPDDPAFDRLVRVDEASDAPSPDDRAPDASDDPPARADDAGAPTSAAPPGASEATPDDAARVHASAAAPPAHADDAGDARHVAAARGPAAQPATPFRALLRTITRYALYDHVRRRLGWTEHSDRRALGTDAARLDDAPEPAARPPMTDWLTVRAQVEAVDEALRRLPDDMQAAVRAWSEGAAPAEIAAACGAESPDAARRLVRAGQARLRAALRDG